MKNEIIIKHNATQRNIYKHINTLLKINLK